MNEEIKKAYLALNGVWPEFLEKVVKDGGFTSYPIAKTKRRLAICVKSCSVLGEEFIESNYCGVGKGANPEKFKIICTKKEFEECGNELRNIK